MKKGLFILYLLGIYASAQTLYTDDNGIYVFYKTEKTNVYTLCNGNFVKDEKYSNKKIYVWKVTFGIKNGSTETIIPRGIGIANMSMNPDPIQPYSQDYCRYEMVEGYGKRGSRQDQSLFSWTIRDYKVTEIKRGAVLENSTYLYLYEGQTPKLSNFQFLGYRLKKDFKPYYLRTKKDTKPIAIEAKVSQPIFVKEPATHPIATKVIAKVTVAKTPITKALEKETTTYTLKNNTVHNSGSVTEVVKVRNSSMDTSIASIEDDKPIVLFDEPEEKTEISSVAITKPVKPEKVTANDCSGKRAQVYKDKSNATKDISEQKAYGWLALYYTYKCECDSGSNRSDFLVAIINNVVDSYHLNTNGSYGEIFKVEKCKNTVLE